MKFSTNKEKGNCGLAMAISYFTTHGYTVSIPLNDTQDYDLLIEKELSINTVQVKSTGFKTKYDIYQVNLRNMGGTKGKVYKTFIDTDIDLLFVLTEKLDMYLFDKRELNNKGTLNLDRKYEKNKVNI